MKPKSKMFAILTVVMPLLFVAFLIISIKNIDRRLTNDTLHINYNEKHAVDVYLASSSRNIVLKTKQYPNVKFSREYSGIITSIFIIPAEIKNDKPQTVNIWFDREYAEQLLNKKSDYNKIPHFGLQQRVNTEKDWWYYFDIYCYIREKYFLLLLPYILLSAFVASKGINADSVFFVPVIIFFAVWLLLFALF